MDNPTQLTQVERNLHSGGVPATAIALIVDRVRTFLTLFDETSDGDLIAMLTEETEGLVEDAAVAANCLYTFEPGWGPLARRLGVDFAVIREGTWIVEGGRDRNGQPG